MTEADRTIAARHLREARRLTGHEALEAVAWARCAVPQSVRAIAFEARLTIEQGDAAEADALIAQGLLLAPTDAGLLTLHARRLLARGLVERAQRVADLALIRRPMHLGLHRLAARIARARGDAPRAADHLRTALGLTPRAPRGVILDLAIILIDLDRAPEARSLLATLNPPSPYLDSLVAERLEGPLAALDCLMNTPAACGGAPCPMIRPDEVEFDSPDILLERRIDLADRVGDLSCLAGWLQAVSSETPRAQLRAARVWLRRGEFETVLERLGGPSAAPLGTPGRTGGCASEHSVLAAIAHVALGQADAAETLLSRHPRRDDQPSRTHVAGAWRDALVGLLARGVSRPDECHPLNGASLVGAFLSDAPEAV